MKIVLQKWLIHKIQKDSIHAMAKKYIRGKLIDIGCGIKPYEDLLAQYVSWHIGIDHTDTLHDKSNVDLFCTAYQIAVKDASFDSALCTSVLEHLEEPKLAIAECNRVLKPGGVAIYMTPFIWHIHESPRDFYRFSKFGLKYLFEKVEFEILELKALSGFWVSFGQLFVYTLYRFNRGPLRWLHIIDGISLLIQMVTYVLNKIDKSEPFTCMYIIAARKK